MEFAPTRPSPLATNHSPLATPLRPLRSRNRDGVALVLTLGLMAMMAILVVSFTLTVRLDRLSARNYRDQVVARQYAQVALDRAMETVDWALGPDTNNPPKYGGRLSPFGFEDTTGWWLETDGVSFNLDQSRNVLGSYATNTVAHLRPGESKHVQLFTGSITNHVPAALWDEAETIESYWNYIVYEPVDLEGTSIPDATSVTNGRIAFMVLDVSGFLDARQVTSNMFKALPESRETHPDSYEEDFAANIKRYAPFFSLPDLAAVVANPDTDTDWDHTLIPPIENLFHLSYDPGPEVWAATNAPGLGYAFYSPFNDEDRQWLTLGSRAIEDDLSLRFNVNSLTNVLKNAGADDRYSGTEFEAYFGELQEHLRAAGFPDPETEETAWNLVNALDDYDYIPRSDSLTPWREHYGIKPTPRINEFVLFSLDEPEPSGTQIASRPTDTDPAKTNHYALAVELWYPFVTNVLAAGEAELVVAVFTNATDAAGFLDFANTSDVSDGSDDIGDFGFVEELPAMAYGSPDEEFAVVHSPDNRFINFPFKITYQDEAVSPNTITVEGFMPIGRFDFAELPIPEEFLPSPQVVTNTLWFQARVRMREGNTPDGAWRWVDEAFLRSPDQLELVPFAETVTVAWSVIDPRRNTWSEYWTATNATLSEMNAPTHDFFENIPSGGLPIYLPNAPLNRIGDLGAISLGGEDNLWQTIDLTTLEGAHLLDRLTIAETNAPAYGRVHVGTSQTNVIRALLADIEIGFPGARASDLRPVPLGHRNDAGEEAFPDALETLTRAWFDAQAEYGLGQRYAELFHAFGQRVMDTDNCWLADTSYDPATSRDLKEQVLRGLVDRLSFRQNLFVVIGVGQAISPARRVVGEHRMAALVVRDAYTGRWQRLRTFHLTE